MKRKLKLSRYIETANDVLYYTVYLNENEVFYSFKSDTDTFYIAPLEYDPKKNEYFFTHTDREVSFKYIPYQNRMEFSSK